MTRGTAVPETGGLMVVRPEPFLLGQGDWRDHFRSIQLMSDLHIGAANTDYGLIDRELLAVKINKGRLLLGGDIFDLILPRDRKRYSPSDLHPRLQGRSDIQNELVEWGVEILYPYVDYLDGIGVGNHEAAAEAATNYDTVKELVRRLNEMRDPRLRPIGYLGYTGYIEYTFKAGYGVSEKKVGRYVIWYHHGAGRVSTGIASLQKLVKATTSFAADLWWSGHSHARGSVVEAMLHTKKGKVVTRDVRCVVTGGYMASYGSQSQESIRTRGRQANYPSDQGMAPHGLGGARVLLHFNRPGFPSKVEVVQ